MRPAARTGLLVAVEGPDGVGKTTFSRQLAEAIDARWTTTPDPSVRVVREAVESSWASSPAARRVFYAASVLACSDLCAPLLDRGESVVVDRYWASTLAYAAIDGSDVRLGHVGEHVRRADVTFHLWLPSDVRLERLRARGMTPSDVASVERGDALDAHYARALATPHAGRVVSLDGRWPTDALVASAVVALREVEHGRSAESPRGGQLSLFGASN